MNLWALAMKVNLKHIVEFISIAAIVGGLVSVAYQIEQSTQIARSQYHLYTAWFDPSKKGKITFPRWKILLEYFKATCNAPIPWSERNICYLYLLNWLRKKRYRLREDLTIASQLFWTRWRTSKSP